MPLPLRDSPLPGRERSSAPAERYRYPPDVPDGVVAQQYPPDELVGRDYYEPAGRGAERAIAERLAKLRDILRAAHPIGSAHCGSLDRPVPICAREARCPEARLPR